MERFGDGLVFLVALIALAWWIWRRFDKWLHEPPSARLRKLAKAEELEIDDTVLLLQEQGYEVLSGKHRVPLGVSVDDGPLTATRLYFDYVATKDNRYYLVKLDRARQPLDFTPSGLREKLLVYALLFPECDGIVVADPKDKVLRTVRFRVEVETE